MVAYPEAEQRIVKLTPLAEAHAAIDALARPVEPREVNISVALGRVLAADAKAPAMQPASAVALHDGWAVKSDETLDAGSYAPALLSALPQRLDFGQPLPPGADAVAPLDTIVVRGAQAEALATVAPGEGVLPVGRDAEADLPLRLAGERLRATDQALLSVAGISRVTIREPRIYPRSRARRKRRHSRRLWLDRRDTYRRRRSCRFRRPRRDCSGSSDGSISSRKQRCHSRSGRDGKWNGG